MLPMNLWIWNKMQKYQTLQMLLKDKRVRAITEVLSGIKVLKFFCWENSFIKKIRKKNSCKLNACIKLLILIKSSPENIRLAEVRELKLFQYLLATQFFTWTLAPLLVSLFSFGTFVLAQGGTLDAQTTFVSLSLFNTLRGPLFQLPFGIVALIQGQVAVGRISKFLSQGELDPDSVTKDDSPKYPVQLKNASFTWESPTSQVILKDLSLDVDQGILIAIVGSVGSGKSSLLSALLGEMVRVGGEANIRSRERIAYLPQQAWMQNATLRDNILFGEKYEKKFYNLVLDACALRPDLEILAGGDETEIGEKGINVSGGQKQRISLARAVYCRASVYLLDDPLSAVDTHVGKHLFQQVIGPEGMLRSKTRLLVTHAISYLSQVDKIIVMKDGRISEMGTYNELLADGGAFADFLIDQLESEMENEDNESTLESESEMEALKHQLEETFGKKDMKKRLSRAKRRREKATRNETICMSDDTDHNPTSTYSTVPGIFSPGITAPGDADEVSMRSRVNSIATTIRDDSKVGKYLIQEETAEINKVKLSIYGYYARSMGLSLTLVAVIFYAIFQAFNVSGNVWLSVWSSDSAASTNVAKRNKYLAVYGVLGVLQATFLLIALIMITMGTVKASICLHNDMLSHILHSTMAFFDTTPLGRIINRFSKDMDEIDLMIPSNIKDILTDLFSVIGTLTIVIYSFPLIGVVVVPIIGLFLFIQSRYLAASRQLKRLVSVTRSPINSSLTESMSGATTIRAFNVQHMFIGINEDRVEYNQKFNYPEVVTNSWLFNRLEMAANLLIISVSLCSVIFRDQMDPGLIGLSLTYALTCQIDIFLLTR